VLRLGFNVHDGSPVEITLDERRQGTYIIGTTGTGKSTLLRNIVYHDMLHDRTHGLCVLDPHGDLVDELIGLIPDDRIEDVILLDPMDIDYPLGLNLLDFNRDDPEEVYWVVSSVMGAFKRQFLFSWGPRLEHVLRNTLITTLKYPDSTFVDLLFLLMSTKEERRTIARDMKDPVLCRFWETFPASERLEYELVSSTLNKVSPYITDIRMRNIVGQPDNRLKLQEIMDGGKILFVNLSKGDLGEDNSSLLGSMLVNMIWLAALKRRSQAVNQRKPFHLIVDEFQNFATESFSVLQSEARKYAVDVIVAHQFRDQLEDPSKGSTLNVGNMIVFRVTGRDSYSLASQYDNTPPPADTRVEPVYQGYNYKGMDFLIETELSTREGKLYQEVELPRRPYSDVEAEMANRLSILPNYEAWCRLIHQPKSRNERGTPRLVERHLRTEFHENEKEKTKEEKRTEEEKKKILEIVRENSRKLARPRAEVEEEINRRMILKTSVPEVETQEVLQKLTTPKPRRKPKPPPRRYDRPKNR
jgi:DNA segregation ATPase FtsK/SpoIIIE-like protein